MNTPNQHPPVIRHARLEDIPQITEIYNYYVEHTKITFDLEPRSIDDRTEWFHQFADAGPYRLLVADVNGVIGGYASSLRVRPKPAYMRSVETSIYVHPQQKGQGLGKALYAKLFEFLGNEEVHRAYGVIAVPNEDSVALHKAFGFKHVGTLTEAGYKFGDYVDVEWYEKVMRDIE